MEERDTDIQSLSPSSRRNVVVDEEVSFNCRGSMARERPALIFSTATGLHLFDYVKGISKRILRGKCYGIARCRDQWLFSLSSDDSESKADRLSDIGAVRLQDFAVERLRWAITGIPGEIHQIDVCNGTLYLPHTGHNRVLHLPVERVLNAHSLLSFSACKAIGLDIPEPSHLNSVFADPAAGKVYLVAHNDTGHTGRSSDVIVYDENSGDVEIIPTDAHSAHNIYVRDGELMYCDSGRGRLIRGHEPIFEAEKLLRGLSITDDRIYVGGSEKNPDRGRRKLSDAAIYILDKTGDPLAQVQFPGVGDIYEIRQLHAFDYAMTASYAH
jgi:hypothetical protein